VSGRGNSQPIGDSGGSLQRDLVTRLQREFAEENLDQLLRIALYKCDFHRPDAEDLTQETLIRVLRGWRRWVDGEKPSLGYATTTMRRAHIDLWRRRRTRPTEIHASDEVLEAMSAPQESSAATSHSELRRAVESLPPRHRRLIESVYYQGLTLMEFADQTRISRETAHNYHSQALAELRRKFSHQLVSLANEEGQNGR
jgi:RNA polymerase sigma-70 factor, ECF subfamily